MKVLHTVASLDRKFGGPSQSIASLCSSLAQQGQDISILSLDLWYNCTTSHILPGNQVQTVLVPGYYQGKIGQVWSTRFKPELRRHADKHGIDILHDNGVWLQTNHNAASVAHRLNIPLIVSPRGMLEPWALGQKAWKKRLAWRLYQAHDLEVAGVLHATSQQEANNLRRLGLQHPIALIPNGVELPSYQNGVSPSASLRTALFLSRIHPGKGLSELVKAWDAVRPKDWHLVIAGPDNYGHRAEIETEVRQKRLGNVIKFIGPAYGDRKKALFRKADLFILPTRSESFGVVIAEALAARLPVITTKGAPWAELQTHHCGWWIDTGVESLEMALREATSLSDAGRAAMGKRGRALIELRYTWPRIASEMQAVYEWMLGSSPKPGCVRCT